MDKVEHIHAEMDALPYVHRMIEKLGAEAPSSRLLQALREAVRHAHPACTDIRNNLALHQAHASSRGYELQLPENMPAVVAQLQAPSSPAALPAELTNVLLAISARLAKLETSNAPPTEAKPAG